MASNPPQAAKVFTLATRYSESSKEAVGSERLFQKIDAQTALAVGALHFALAKTMTLFVVKTRVTTVWTIFFDDRLL
ncbi:Hypothetical Protein FCC1311_005810 [Hondaea fermentalgiana]|uniref:Uncharacterized protein n=1 Tax=Hondaea fermentalgiana TaxID=2315210 RepID=A0A2R5GX55_9STRA|nr:Hypothetical Protein FCC1311_005810 [Hondaea fermentalgiana]|eukprot:GBG32991.1 Hypothetical Protein FCC1311_005810 [Hondaea fermentalgiana]